MIKSPKMNTIKTNIQNLAMLSAVITFASCEQHKQSKVTKSGTEVVKVRTPQEDTLDKSAEPQMESRSIEATVVEINSGKDGYTAKVETGTKEIYFATVSHANLKDHSQYKTLKPGDKVHLAGDFWKMNDENQLTVRELH